MILQILFLIFISSEGLIFSRCFVLRLIDEQKGAVRGLLQPITFKGFHRGGLASFVSVEEPLIKQYEEIADDSYNPS
jgi:hypothetical protein